MIFRTEVLRYQMDTISISDIKTLLNEQTKDIKKDIKRNFKHIESKIYKNSKKITELEKRCLYLERKIRKNNIIIFGLNISDENLVTNTILKLNTYLESNITENDINNIYKLNKNEKSPIIVEFIRYLRKAEIFKNIEKLKALKEHNISISNDLCMIDRQNQKILREHYKCAKEKNLNTKIRGHKLIIEDKVYTAEELEKADEDTDETSGETEEEEDQDIDETETSVDEEVDEIKTKPQGSRLGKKDQEEKSKEKRKTQTTSPSPATTRTKKNTRLEKHNITTRTQRRKNKVTNKVRK